MKKIPVLIILFFLATANIHAQLADSKWKNVINIPDPNETILEFKKDTALLTITSDGTLIETMSFSINKDTLRITKLVGMSPCNSGVVGIYHFDIKDDKLTISLIADDCSERVNAFKSDPWTREDDVRR